MQESRAKNRADWLADLLAIPSFATALSNHHLAEQNHKMVLGLQYEMQKINAKIDTILDILLDNKKENNRDAVL